MKRLPLFIALCPFLWSGCDSIREGTKPGFVVAGKVTNHTGNTAYLFRSSEATFPDAEDGLIATAEIDPDGYFYLNGTADKPDFYKVRIGEIDYVFDYEDDFYIQLYDTILFEANMERFNRSVTFKGMNAKLNQFTWDLYEFSHDREYRFKLQPEYNELTPLKFGAYNNELMADKYKFYKGYFAGFNDNLEQKRYVFHKGIYQHANNVYTYLGTTVNRLKTGRRYLLTEFDYFKVREKVSIDNENFVFLYPYREFLNNYLTYLYERSHLELEDEEKDKEKFSIKVRIIKEHFENKVIRDVAFMYLSREFGEFSGHPDFSGQLSALLGELEKDNSGTVYYRYFKTNADKHLKSAEIKLP